MLRCAAMVSLQLSMVKVLSKRALQWGLGWLLAATAVLALCYWLPTHQVAQPPRTSAAPIISKMGVAKTTDLLPPRGDAVRAASASAQYYLSKALEYRADVNRSYFSRRGQPIDLDQALQNASRLHQRIDLVELAHARCHEFLTEDASHLGSAADWLASATRAGQPLAQSQTALKLVAQGALNSFAKAGAVSNIDS